MRCRCAALTGHQGIIFSWVVTFLGLPRVVHVKHNQFLTEKQFFRGIHGVTANNGEGCDLETKKLHESFIRGWHPSSTFDNRHNDFNRKVIRGCLGDFIHLKKLMMSNYAACLLVWSSRNNKMKIYVTKDVFPIIHPQPWEYSWLIIQGKTKQNKTLSWRLLEALSEMNLIALIKPIIIFNKWSLPTPLQLLFNFKYTSFFSIQCPSCMMISFLHNLSCAFGLWFMNNSLSCRLALAF